MLQKKKTCSLAEIEEDEEKEEDEEEIEISEDLIDEIVEKLTVDMGATLSGWAGRSAYSQKWEMEKEMAHRRGTKAQEDLEILKKTGFAATPKDGNLEVKKIVDYICKNRGGEGVLREICDLIISIKFGKKRKLY